MRLPHGLPLLFVLLSVPSLWGQAPDPTLLLLVEGDAARLGVSAAWRRPAPFAAGRRAVAGAHVRLVGVGETTLAEVPLDLSRFRLDRVKEPLVLGDQVFAGRIQLLVKVPDFGPRLARLEFVRTDGRRRARVIGSISAALMRRLLASPQPMAAPVVKTHLNNGPVQNRYDIVIIGDGYQITEQARFYTDIANWMSYLFAREPFKSYKGFFNVHSVFRASKESGADHPDRNPPIVRDTVYDATYNYGNTPRCLYIKNQSQASRDAALAPDVEGRVVVFVNDPRYGGCAGVFAVSYNGATGSYVQTHEFGHSFGGLADEYGGNPATYSGPEPRQANVTADKNCTKWSIWKGFNGVGCWEGGLYHDKGIWRPKANCLMRNISALCEVCVEHMAKQGYVTVDPIENRSPATTNVIVKKPNSQRFSFTHLVPGSHRIEWTVDAKLVASGTPSFTWSPAGYAPGKHVVRAMIKDLTTLVRKDPSNLLTSSTSWNVDLQSSGNKPGTYTTFGAGCPGSRKDPVVCVAANVNGSNLGHNLRLGITYALRFAPSTNLRIRGFELNTSSRRSGSVSVPAYLYNADLTGKPYPRIRTGSMVVGPNLGWYRATFSTPYDATRGRWLFVSITNPNPTIQAAVVTGTNVTYFRDDGPNRSWVGPITDRAWGFKVICEGPSASIPTLTAHGVPEIGGAFDVVLGHAVSSTPVVLYLGASNTRWGTLPLPLDLTSFGGTGCKLLVSPDLALAAASNTLGSATIRLGIPNDPRLVDTKFHNQFYVIDLQANPMRVAWTNGGTGKIGQP